MSGGDSYQARVAAWFCVQILVEKNAPTAWDLESGETFEIVECHTANPVDDIFIETSLKRRFFINVKIDVDNEQKADSRYAGFIAQAVRQFIQNQELGETKSRILLATSPSSSEIIVKHLRNVFSRVRNTEHQPLAKIPKNAKEKEALKTFIAHARHFWKEVTGITPSEKQIQYLAQSIWIEVLDVDKGKSDEMTAQFMLNSQLNEANEKGEEAWKLLTEYCRELYKQSGSTKRALLRNELSRLKIKLKATPSFEADIEKLKKLSRKNLARHPEFSLIKVGEKEIKISRPVKNALMNAAEESSTLVTGDAGSGKSGVLYDLVDGLIIDERDVVFIPVDKLEAVSQPTLRHELQLEHDLTEVLNEWTGDKPGFFVIDALDASRDPNKAKFLNSLIEDVIFAKNRWRVVASIRRFDLRYNPKLNSLFAGRAVEGFELLEFPNLRHINVSFLQVEEMMQVFYQHRGFADLYLAGESDLQKLLFLPFNLKLVGELFADNVKLEELSPVRAQVELLERYWLKRVRDSVNNADSNEIALGRIVELMVERREMQLSRGEVLDKVSETTLGEILHRGVLTEGQDSNGKTDSSVIDFPHHVLFDYAVARLFLRGTKNTLIEKLERDRELVLAIRPSIVFHFQYELLKGNQYFWEQVFAVYRSEIIPTIGKLVPASVAVNSAKNIDFFEPLFQKLAATGADDKKVGKQILSHISHELRYRSSIQKDNPILNNPRLWLNFLEKLSAQLKPETVNDVRYIFWNFIDLIAILNSEELTLLGVIARRLLDFVLTLPNQEFFLISNAITFVCRTFATNPDESVNSLRPVLGKSRVREYGHRELKFFADEIESLSTIRPDFVGEIYRAAFTNVDLSDETTSISFSRILNLTSTREQDFMHMRFSLRTKFGSFLRQSPLVAIRVLIEIFDSYGEQAYIQKLEDRKAWYSIAGIDTEGKASSRLINTFNFRGIQAQILSDYSRSWDDGASYRDEEILNFLGTFRNYLEKQCEEESETLAEILDLLVRNNKMAVFWRKIISCGIKFPESMGRDIRSLAWTLPVLTNEDTYEVVAEYLQANFSQFTEEERTLAEKAILSLPQQSSDKSEKGDLIYVRNYLLSYLDENYIICAQTRKVINNFRRKYEQRRQSEVFNDYEPAVEPETISLEKNAELKNNETPFERNLLTPIKSFAEKERRLAPVLEEFRELLPVARSLYEIISNPDTAPASDIPQNLIDKGWHYLSKFCNVAVETEDLSANLEVLSFLQEVMLAASRHPDPISDKDGSITVDDFPWSDFPFTRGNAGKGLARLARFEASAREEVLERVEYLALKDSVQAVRYHTAVVLYSLYETAPAVMWRTLAEICQNENSFRVLRGVTESSLNRLAYKYPNEVFELNKTVFERIEADEKAGNIRKNCILIFMHLAFKFGHEGSWGILNAYVNDPQRHKDVIWQIVTVAGNSITAGIDEPHDRQKSRIRISSFKALERICRAAHNAFQGLYSSLSGKETDLWTEQEKEDYKNLHRIIEHIALKIYFASGADKHHSTSLRKEYKVPETDEERILFWNESKVTLDALAEVGFADVTHRLVETFEHLFPSSPREVFLLFGKTIRNGKRDLYQYESMAISNVVALVTKVFSPEFSYLLKECRECREVTLEVLDTFVEAGWEPALKLTYRLNEVYR